MKNKKRVKELLRRIRERIKDIDDDELKEWCKEAEEKVETEDDGSNPPQPPPGKKP